MKNKFKIMFDPDAMESDARQKMEADLNAVAERYGWKFYASGCDTSAVRTRDICFER